MPKKVSYFNKFLYDKMTVVVVVVVDVVTQIKLMSWVYHMGLIKEVRKMVTSVVGEGEGGYRKTGGQWGKFI